MRTNMMLLALVVLIPVIMYALFQALSVVDVFHAALACSFHRCSFTPNTRSHSMYANSP